MMIKCKLNRTVGELLFSGYQEVLMDFKKIILGVSEGEEGEEGKISRFGWFYGVSAGRARAATVQSSVQRNGSSAPDGELRMYTGAGAGAGLGQLVDWDRPAAFPGECGAARGSAGGLFPPGMAAAAPLLRLFSTDLCTALTFSRAGGGTGEMVGLDTVSFVLDRKNFANSSYWPGAACYSNNLRTGILNLTTCRGGGPLFVSKPHFYQVLFQLKKYETVQEYGSPLSHIKSINFEFGLVWTGEFTYKQTGWPLELLRS